MKYRTVTGTEDKAVDHKAVDCVMSWLFIIALHLKKNDLVSGHWLFWLLLLYYLEWGLDEKVLWKELNVSEILL